MTRITATDRTGQVHEIDGEDDEALMFILRDDNDLPVEGTCGGTASCGTCHIYVDADWFSRLPERQSHETSLLDSLDHYDAAKSRLGCQITLTPQLEGLKLTLAPEE